MRRAFFLFVAALCALVFCAGAAAAVHVKRGVASSRYLASDPSKLSWIGFNEPDSVAESNVTPQRAAALWPQLERTGLSLGSPAPATPATAGTTSRAGSAPCSPPAVG